jgi:EAL domain-containing protein (putative c-di-GMP-specific phosphodiesterase class I)
MLRGSPATRWQNDLVDEFLREMDSELIGWADPVQRLRTAIDKDEFELYCQPILALQGGERYPLAEVLVRLREEEKALVPPGEFLPVFEHYRMMPQLDRWVVRHTIKRLAQGSRIPRFTVNVHGQTLEDAEFPRFVAAQLSSNQVAAERLLFEIDESDALLRLGAASQFAAAYRAVGGALLVDGFGRRSVSFLPIKELGVQFVKVDGSITRKLLRSEVASTKMNAVLRVSEALKFSIVAECVEEQDVLARLKGLGCAYAQGFGIYQPHPIASVAIGPNEG